MRLIVLAAVLYCFWLFLSGHLEPLLLAYGVASVAIAVAFAWRLDIIDDESFPIHLTLRGVLYWPWLIVEIFKSAIDVTLIILNPRLPISPTLTRIPARQKGAVGLTTYANSITLTPGTISAVVSERRHEILVHGLTEDSARALDDGEMDRRAAEFEGGS
jgi:multicomponent Na+:H+ antiporter subunit E